MTEQRTPTATDRGGIPAPRTASDEAPTEEAAAGMGWVRFAGIVMIAVGGFGLIEGLVALFIPAYFVAAGGAILAINLSGWGWLHIIVAILVLATGFSLLGNAPAWARSVAIGLVAINMFVQFAWMPAYPIWALVVIALDVLVLYALVATWGQRATR